MAKYLDQAGLQVLWTKIKSEDAKKLSLAGGELTGTLTLSADPESAMHAATKQYVDTKTASVHKPQVYSYVGDTTDIATAVAAQTGVAFASGDVMVITDSNGVSAAYQFDDDNGESGEWVALVGKVNADNVILKQDITCAGNYTAVGNITKSSTGTTTIDAEGKSVTAVLQQIFTKVLQPTITNPSASITLTGAGNKEVGSTFTPVYSISFNKGKYSYDSTTGVAATAYAVTDTNDSTATAASGAIGEAFTVADNTNYYVSATVSYSAGTVAKDNLGNDSNPVKQIAAGSCSTNNSSAVKGYRSYFYGVVNTSSADAPLSSAVIRALTNGGIYSSSKTLNLAANSVSGAKRVIVAVPSVNTSACNARNGLTKVLMPSAMNADATDSFVLQSNVQVNDASGANPVAYKVWVYEPAAIDSSETYTVTLA